MNKSDMNKPDPKSPEKPSPGDSGPSANNPKMKSPFLWLMLLAGAFMMINLSGPQPDEMVFSHFVDDLKKGNYRKVVIFQNHVHAYPVGKSDGFRENYTLLNNDGFVQEFTKLLDELRETKKPDGVTPLLEDWTFSEENQLLQFFGDIFPFLLIFFLMYFFFLRPMRGSGGIGAALNFGRSRATAIAKGKTGVTFNDVAGIDEAKEEVQEIIEFLKNPAKFQRLGGRIPRGVLLVGSPGTGKTLLAKAIAGEADVPFFSISGSDFVEMFVGVGASRVRDLFQQAKSKAPCIIFLDEIDAVGRKRGVAVGGGGDEREQTLNAILVEMDGIESDCEVVIIAATNRADVLDQALLRPGRFDRQVYVDLPDIAGREQILKVHAKKIKLASSVDLHRLAVGTPGFSGADLAATINEAALYSAMLGKDQVEYEDLDHARDKIAFGKKKRSRMAAMTEEDKRVTAYHEAGHAVLAEVIDSVEPVYKVTIIPTGRALGMTMFLPEREKVHTTRKKLTGELIVAYGGRVAEELFCGDISTGAHNDIDMATRLARAMVVEYGMSDTLGPVNYSGERDETWGTQQSEHGDNLKQVIDQEVRSFLDHAVAEARKLLEEHSAFVEDIAKYLMVYETLDREDLNEIKNGKPPRRQLGSTPVELKGPKKNLEESPQEPIKPVADNPDDDLGLTPAL